MSERWERTIPAAELLCVSVWVLSSATAQTSAPTLAEQLAAQYKLVNMGPDTGGTTLLAQMVE